MPELNRRETIMDRLYARSETKDLPLHIIGEIADEIAQDLDKLAQSAAVEASDEQAPAAAE